MHSTQYVINGPHILLISAVFPLLNLGINVLVTTALLIFSLVVSLLRLSRVVDLVTWVAVRGTSPCRTPVP